jgi:hypothetical protein
MAKITTKWDNDDKTIMVVKYHPGWTWQDMEANMQTEKEYLDSVNHRVDVIADFRGTNLPPGAISYLPKIAQSPPYTHENSGLMAMVGTPNFMKQVVDVYKAVYGQARKLTMLPDLDAARQHIADHYAAFGKKAAKSDDTDEKAGTGGTSESKGDN